jgi:hypothetical protein
MLMAVGGCRIFIGGSHPEGWSLRLTVSSLKSEVWQQMNEVEGIGTLGIDWDTINTADITTRDELGNPMSRIAKTRVRGRLMQIVLANQPDDPGQQRLWAAARSAHDFAFRLDFPVEASGDTAVQRLWLASVTSLGEVFDTANNVMKLQADLQLQSPILKG